MSGSGYVEGLDTGKGETQGVEVTEAWQYSQEMKAIIGKFFYNHSKHCTLIKNKIKFSLYIRKFRVEHLQSHI
jgi:hypothetical protein